jgi:serine protease AprX
MKRNYSVAWHSRPQKRVISSIVVCLLFLPLLIVTPVMAWPLRAQPILLDMVAQQPDAMVNVIVQKTTTDKHAEELVAQLGGTATLDLRIINAFAAELPARAVTELAKAEGVRWVSWDSAVIKTDCVQCVDTDNLKNAYISTIGANRVWNEAPYLQGQGIGVAVVDSGVNPQPDLFTRDGRNRIVGSVHFNSGANQTVYDNYGHGSHVAGIIGGNGLLSDGAYIGVTPQANLINVKVSDNQGAATLSRVIAGLQWIYDNQSAYNIRVVNISLNSSIPSSYHTDPLDAAVEILWFNKIVVVVSAGNDGKNALNSPANDPFVIAVGASDDRGTVSTADDVMASYSGYGNTTDGINKPDLVAPGTNIVSLRGLPRNVLETTHPDHIVTPFYFRMSGTSMAAPMVTGAAALLLQSNPNLTPDQVKYRLMATARPIGDQKQAGAGQLDIYAAIHSNTTLSANTGTKVSKLLSSSNGSTAQSSVAWNSVAWNSVAWNSVAWNSVAWNSVAWNSVDWDD